MSMYIILDFGYSISFSHKTIFKLIFLNNEKTYGDGTIMVYTRLHVLLIDINRIEIGSDSNFGGKVTTSFVNISCLIKNIIKYSWYVFTSNKYYVMVYIKDRSEIGFLSQQQVPRSDHSSKGTNKNNFSVFISCGVVYDNTESRNLRLRATCGCLRASKG